MKKLNTIWKGDITSVHCDRTHPKAQQTNAESFQYNIIMLQIKQIDVVITKVMPKKYRVLQMTIPVYQMTELKQMVIMISGKALKSIVMKRNFA